MLAFAAMLVGTDKVPAMPVLPASSHAELGRVTRLLAEATSARQGSRAKRMLEWLPRRDVTVAIDAANVPIARREAYLAAVRLAIRTWNGVPNGPTIREGKSPHVRIAFGTRLNVGRDGRTPAGAAHFFFDRAQPRFEAVIATQRGLGAANASPLEVQNEAAAALSAYFGLAENPVFGTISSRTDGPANRPTGHTSADVVTFQRVQDYVAALRKRVFAGASVAVANARASTDATRGTHPPVDQGAKVPFRFQLSNAGSTPLEYRAVGDCGCLIVSPAGTLAPNATILLTPKLDTTDYVGDLTKRMTVYTNDPERPTLTFEMRVMVRPQLRWVPVKGDALTVGDDVGRIEYLVYGPQVAQLDWLQLRVDGVRGLARSEPYGQPIVDKALGTTVRDAQARRVTIDVDAAGIVGKRLATISVPQRVPNRPPFSQSFTVQRGIVASPPDLYFGVLDTPGKRMTLVIERPGQAFRVLGVTVEPKRFRVLPTKRVGNDRVELVIEYVGGAGEDVDGTVTVRTDDARQPEIRVPIRGIAG
ncbi:MAG: DUF1573 domain-containing protein [Fimbriimonadaceae bacterium]|nr:DUF1573 domain-containing protein [Fimbriimonadaceae bacterium]